MKFHVKQIVLWFKDKSKPRSIDFLPNKVNVITGAKSTGKSSILSIIDYCFLSTKSRIVEAIINENVEWYGMSFSINDKDFIIVRRRPINSFGSKDIYFDSQGVFPIEPYVNNDFNTVKKIIETEFGIDDSIVIPYGGKKLKPGSKISFRFFLLLNTLSEDTIADTNTFFDFNLYDREKYVEALDRIFFLAIGVDDVNNILIREKLQELENELDKIEKKKKSISKEERLFNDKIIELVIEAQKYDLVEKKLFTHDQAYKRLSDLVNDFKNPAYSNNLKDVDDLNKNKRVVWRKIRNLERFDLEYNEYKKNLQADYDSLRPIEYLKENFTELIPTLEVKSFIKLLETSLKDIKGELTNKKTISVSVKSEITSLKQELKSIEAKLASLPTSDQIFKDEIHKYVFIGELKSQIKFYENKWNILEELPNEFEIEEQIKELQNILKDTITKRKIILEFLEKSIQKYYDITNSMGVYKDYKILFDVTEKKIKLRKPDETLATSNVGSKSNYMFLHLCLFLGLHEHMINQSQGYVPQFLILDQPSQPYLENSLINPLTGEMKNDDDIVTIKDSFSLLNSFMNNIKNNFNNEFQIILLEHASRHYWENPLLENFHFVEEFRDGNALIPKRVIDNDNQN